MKTSTIVGIVIVIILVLGGLYLIAHNSTQTSPTGLGATTTPIGTNTPTAQTVTTPAGVSFSYADPYGLATSPQQITAQSVVPPCLAGFDYCLYRTGTEFSGTNFESAGVAVKQRTDLLSNQTCLSAQPDGYTNLHATTSTQSGYSTSAFSPLSDAGAGHYSAGAEYRLWTGSTCYQFDTTVGETQFANYPAGTKTLFTDDNRATVMTELKGLLAGVKVNGTPVVFPQV